jgi:hypothetical protein
MRDHARLLSLSLLTLTLGLPGPVRSDALPPTEAKPFTAVYNSERRYRLPPDDPEWKTIKDSMTISVSGVQSRWEYKSDGRIAIYDYGKRTLIEYGGKHAARTAARFHFTSIPLPIGWEFGSGKASRTDGAKSQVVGKATIAGQECTRVVVESEEYGKPEFCVTADGTVLRYEIQALNDSIVYEAQSVTPGTVEPASFQLPAGYAAEDKTLMPPGDRPVTFDRPGGMSPNAP